MLREKERKGFFGRGRRKGFDRMRFVFGMVVGVVRSEVVWGVEIDSK